MPRCPTQWAEYYWESKERDCGVRLGVPLEAASLPAEAEALPAAQGAEQMLQEAGGAGQPTGDFN